MKKVYKIGFIEDYKANHLFVVAEDKAEAKEKIKEAKKIGLNFNGKIEKHPMQNYALKDIETRLPDLKRTKFILELEKRGLKIYKENKDFSKIELKIIKNRILQIESLLKNIEIELFLIN